MPRCNESVVTRREVTMIHHVAITPADFGASKKFYTEVMGFPVVKAVKRQAMGGESAGWTKHVFFDTGHGSLLALWDLHLTDLEPGSWRASISAPASNWRVTTSRSRA